MRLIGKICLLVGLALFFTNCHGAKYHYKNGKRYAEARMLKESVTSYKKAIDRRPSKTKFRIAMDQAGTALLEELYTNYRFADGDDSVSVYKFLEAEKWRTYLKPYINTSTFEGFYERDYQEQLSRFLEAKYIRSQKWIRTREFERAQKNLEEIKSLSPDYKDVKHCWNLVRWNLFTSVHWNCSKRMNSERCMRCYSPL